MEKDKRGFKSSISESFFDKFVEVNWEKNRSKNNPNKPQFKKQHKPSIFVKNGEISTENGKRKKKDTSNSMFRNVCLGNVEEFNPALLDHPRNKPARSNNFQKFSPKKLAKQKFSQFNSKSYSFNDNFKKFYGGSDIARRNRRWMRSVSESETSNICEVFDELHLLEQHQILYTADDEYLTSSTGSTAVCSQTDTSQDESDNFVSSLNQFILKNNSYIFKEMEDDNKLFPKSNFEDSLPNYKIDARNFVKNNIHRKRSISQPSSYNLRNTNEDSPFHNNKFSSPGNNNKLGKKRRKPKPEDKFEGLIAFEEAMKGLRENTLIKGELRINPKNYTEAYITHPEDRQDVLIVSVADRNRALDGDIVVVKIKEEDKWRKQQNGVVHKTGKVVHILELVHKRSLIGTVHKHDYNYVLVRPRDHRLPRVLVAVATLPDSLRNNLEEFADVYYKAQIVCWNSPKFAQGLIVCTIGKKGEISAETEAILRELDLDSAPVPESLNKYLPPLPYTIPQEEIDNRLDLRKETIFSIDPETARDLDDAVSIKKIATDKYEVGVHISDVSYFLTEGTPLDDKVSDRATTIYMVDRVNHMLPIPLCLLCSLLPGEDKLAFSVIWEMNGEGNILNTKFCRTVINSCAQLSYGHAQDIIDGKNSLNLPTLYNRKTEEEIKDSILALHSISKCLTAKRFAGGALRIDQPKVAFKLDKNCLPYDAALYVLKDSNRLIEEFMLLANQSVAAFIHKKYPEVALLRRHPPPKEDMIVRLEASLNKLGIFIETGTSGDLHSSLLKYTHDDPARAIVLNCLCSKAMSRALYYCDEPDTHHYALNIDMYTHFTSPIRRYVDIVVHRVLAASLGYAPLPPVWTTNTVREYAKNSNQKKYAAKRAGEASSDLFTSLYIKKLGSLETEAVVFNINSHSFDAMVTSLALKIRVYIDDLQDAEIQHQENDIASSLQIKWIKLNYTQVVQMFSEVKLLLKTHETLLQIEAQLLPPNVQSYTSDSSSSYHGTASDNTPYG